MRCLYCDGDATIEERQIRFCACDTSEPFIVDNLPARVCRLCGDKSFSDEAISALETIKNGRAGLCTKQPIRVFDFNNLDKVEETVPYRYTSSISLRRAGGINWQFGHLSTLGLSSGNRTHFSVLDSASWRVY